MSGNNDPTVMALCGDRKVSTVKEVPTDPAFWVRELLIGGQGEARFDRRPIPPGISFCPQPEAKSSCDQIPDEGPTPIPTNRSKNGLPLGTTRPRLAGPHPH